MVHNSAGTEPALVLGITEVKMKGLLHTGGGRGIEKRAASSVAFEPGGFSWHLPICMKVTDGFVAATETPELFW